MNIFENENILKQFKQILEKFCIKKNNTVKYNIFNKRCPVLKINETKKIPYNKIIEERIILDEIELFLKKLHPKAGLT